MTNNMILPIKPHLIDVERVKNNGFSRYDYLRLDKNENIIDFSDDFIEIFKQSINSAFITSYPEVEPLYKRIAQWLNVHEENIYITSGSDGGIKSAFEAFVNQGDKVMILDPTYAMYYVYAKIFQAELIAISYQEDLSINIDQLLDNIKKERPKLICIANPNSPTGTIITPFDIKRILETAKSVNCVALIDEAYYPFYPISAIGLINEFENLIVTRTFSKAESLASVRLGYVIAQSAMIQCLYKVRPMYETNAFAVKFAEIVLNNYHIIQARIEAVLQGKKYIENQLDSMGIKYHRSYANFININVGNNEKSVQIEQKMRQQKILIKAYSGNSPLNNCIRISIGSIEHMKPFINALILIL